LLVATGALALVLAAWAASSDPVTLWHDPPPRQQGGAPAAPPPTVPPETLPPVDQSLPSDGPDLRWLVYTVIALVAVVLAVALVRWLRTVTWRRPRRRASRSVVEPLPDVAAALAEAGAELLDTLRDGTPRNAIVACWVRLEQAVRDAGVVPGPTETSTELTTRVLSGLSMDPAAIESLGALYREARFSRHELGEPERERAIRALTSVQSELRHATETPVPTVDASASS
jgi:hypothetical protein